MKTKTNRKVPGVRYRADPLILAALAEAQAQGGWVSVYAATLVDSGIPTEGPCVDSRWDGRVWRAELRRASSGQAVSAPVVAFVTAWYLDRIVERIPNSMSTWELANLLWREVVLRARARSDKPRDEDVCRDLGLVPAAVIRAAADPRNYNSPAFEATRPALLKAADAVGLLF